MCECASMCVHVRGGVSVTVWVCGCEDVRVCIPVCASVCVV